MLRNSPPWIWILIFALAATAGLLWLAADAGMMPGATSTGPRIVHGVVLVTLLASGLIHGGRIGFKTMLGAGFLWLAVGAILMVIYNYRFTLGWTGA